MTAELQCTQLEAILGLGLYAIGFGLVPLVTSSFSEVCRRHSRLNCSSQLAQEVGRRPVYIFSSLMFTLTQVMCALCVLSRFHGITAYPSDQLRAPNIQAVIMGRLLGGIFGSTGASLVGGSIADIWQPQE